MFSVAPCYDSKRLAMNGMYTGTPYIWHVGGKLRHVNTVLAAS